MNIREPVFDTEEGRILCEWAKRNSLSPNEYSIIECSIDSICVGDVVTIRPACYDDLPRSAYVVKAEPRPFVVNGRTSGMVICGFVFDIPGREIILRRNQGDCWSPM